jgi:hypothetical protein
MQAEDMAELIIATQTKPTRIYKKTVVFGLRILKLVESQSLKSQWTISTIKPLRD